MRALLALCLLLLCDPAHAKARPGHVHWDLFGEEDILMGFKAGPQVVGYTAIQTSTAIIDVQSSMRASIGTSVQFVYAVPRFEFDFLLNTRGGINTRESLYSVAVPVILKFAAEGDKDVDFFAGPGIQPEFVLFGFEPHSGFIYGVLGTIGLSADLPPFVFEFELRYVVGISNIADSLNGARPRDFQMLGGIMWHF